MATLEYLKNAVANKKTIKEKYQRKYRKSNDVRVMYLYGMYLEENNEKEEALHKYVEAIKKDHRFTPPYTQILNFTKEPEYLYNLYDKVILKKTYIDLFESTETRVNIDTTVMYTQILYELLKEAKNEIDNKELLSRVVKGVENYPEQLTFDILIKWKSFIHHLIYMYRHESMELQFYVEKCFKSKLNDILDLSGEEKYKIRDIHKKIIQGYQLVSNYQMSEVTSFCDMDELYNTKTFEGPHEKNEKIRIGYISPDFRTNATMYHTTVLMKYYNPEKFEIYCYHTSQKKDEVTDMFKSYDVKFFNVSCLTSGMRNTLIKRHNIDILVDLIVLGTNGDIDLISMAPAPVVINYIGYPGSGLIKSYTHRITDKKIDEKVTEFYSEKLIFMPRCFLCWRLPDILNEVKISAYRFNKLRIGVMSRALKVSNETLETCKFILQKMENVVLCIKIDFEEEQSVYKSLPQEKVMFLYRTETEEEYFDLFNYFDVLLDSYPYSGTNTTNNGLYMGVPTFCMYNPSWPHVSNVSGGIMKNMEENKISDIDYSQFVCKNGSEVVEKIINFKENVNKNYRNKVREDFKKLMDPVKFMEEYEQQLLATISC